MNNMNTKPLCGVKLFPDKSKEFNHSDEEFEEVLEDGLKLNDQVLQLKKQVEVQERDNLALIKRNMELESENSKLKSMLAKAKVDFTKQEGATESDMVNESPNYRQHAMQRIDKMVEVFGVEAAKAYCKFAACNYRYRAPFKGKFEEDNANADLYLKKLAELDSKKSL